MRVATNDFTVAPQRLSGAKKEANFQAEHFGSAIYKEEGERAKAFEQIGVSVGAYVDKKKEQERDLELSKINREYSDLTSHYLYNENDGVMNSKQLNAKDLPQKSKDGLLTIRQQLAKGIKDPVVRQQFEKMADGFEGKVYQSSLIKETEQLDLAQKSEREATLRRNSTNIALAAGTGNMDGILEPIFANNKVIADQGIRDGWSPATIVQEQNVWAGKAVSGAIDLLRSQGKIDQAEQLYTEARGVLTEDYLIKYEDIFRKDRERQTLIAEKEVKRQVEAQKKDFTNRFNLLDPSSPDFEDQAAEFAETARINNWGTEYKMVNTVAESKRKEKEEGPKKSNLDALSTLNRRISMGSESYPEKRTAVVEGVASGLISYNDAKALYGKIDKQEVDGVDQVDKQSLQQAESYFERNITEPKEQKQANVLLQMGNYKGPEIMTAAENIVGKELYKGNLYETYEGESKEKARYWKDHGDLVVHDLDRATQNWGTTKQILDAVGTSSKSPVFRELLDGYSRLGKPIKVDEFLRDFYDANDKYHNDLEGR